MNTTNLILNSLTCINDSFIHQAFVDRLCEQHNVFLSFIGNDYYTLLKYKIITPAQKLEYAKYVDTFNSFQYIIRDSLSVAEIENAMAMARIFVETTFVDNPKFAEYLLFKIELLGYNKIEYVINYAAGCYNYELDTNFIGADFNFNEDRTAYYHTLSGIDYEPELFKSPFNSNSMTNPSI